MDPHHPAHAAHVNDGVFWMAELNGRLSRWATALPGGPRFLDSLPFARDDTPGRGVIRVSVAVAVSACVRADALAVPIESAAAAINPDREQLRRLSTQTALTRRALGTLDGSGGRKWGQSQVSSIDCSHGRFVAPRDALDCTRVRSNDEI